MTVRRVSARPHPVDGRRTAPASRSKRAASDAVFDSDEPSLLDVVDNVLAKGVVLTGEITLALANVDLVYLRLSLLLCAADRVLPGEDSDAVVRQRDRRVRRASRARPRP